MLCGHSFGLIPAHAGKTDPHARSADEDWAHPRSRGENRVAARGAVNDAGSSPLTRGKPSCTGRRTRWAGLIPAHAGKTRTVRARPSSAGAHPRSRGENLTLDDLGWLRTGSSPLTRGKRAPRPYPAGTPGLIPAHAGKTSLASPPTSPPRAHPRSRGENWIGRATRPAAPGSSPLTRGKR